jgi:hypothetical protein
MLRLPMFALEVREDTGWKFRDRIAEHFVESGLRHLQPENLARKKADVLSKSLHVRSFRHGTAARLRILLVVLLQEP